MPTSTPMKRVCNSALSPIRHEVLEHIYRYACSTQPGSLSSVLDTLTEDMLETTKWARINREKRYSNRSVWVGVGLLGNDQKTQVMAVGITCLGHSLVLQLQQGANCTQTIGVYTVTPKFWPLRLQGTSKRLIQRWRAKHTGS